MGYFAEQAIDERTTGEWEDDKRLDRLDGPACSHPARRQYAWHGYDGTLVVCCCECGGILKGAAE